ncbi:hypothetical protein M2R47_09445, partial [Moraxella sp. Tifton1]|uniref:hypothetical protein n=1 Tax=Moraxella oculi TaxID=2940516 RepID=UPI0020114FCA
LGVHKCHLGRWDMRGVASMDNKRITILGRRLLPNSICVSFGCTQVPSRALGYAWCSQHG